MATETQPSTAINTVVHVEIAARDADKLRAFYGGLFGWKFESMPGMETYTAARLGSGDDAMGVAIYPRENEGPGVTNYVGVASVEEHVGKVEALGGTIIHRFAVPAMGYGAVALDPEGNVVGLWQHDPTAKE
jgi:uncharacterized protein